MKYNPRVSSSNRKSRKAHFTSQAVADECTSVNRRRSMQVRKDDEVLVICRTYKGYDGKVVQVYLKRWVIHTERTTREKVNWLYRKRWHRTLQRCDHEAQI